MNNIIQRTLVFVVIPAILFFLDVSSFIIYHHQFLQTLSTYLLVHIFSSPFSLMSFFPLLLLGAESHLMYNSFGIVIPLYLVVIYSGFLLQSKIQISFISVVLIALGLWLGQNFLLWQQGKTPLLYGFFTDYALFANLLVLGVFWSLKLLGRQGNRSLT